MDRQRRQRRQRRQGVVSGVAWVLGLAALGMVGLGLGGGPMGHRAALRPVASTATGTDTTPPLALTLGGGPNEDGWYSELADYRWSAKDPESGIDWCQAGSIDPVESAVPRTVYGTCVNGAGIAAPYAGFSYRYDATPPQLHPLTTPRMVTRHGVVLASARARDGLSGVARQGCNGEHSLNTRRPGLHRVRCFAQDRAGNVATATTTYLVVDGRGDRRPS